MAREAHMKRGQTLKAGRITYQTKYGPQSPQKWQNVQSRAKIKAITKMAGKAHMKRGKRESRANKIKRNRGTETNQTHEDRNETRGKDQRKQNFTNLQRNFISLSLCCRNNFN